MGGLKLKYFLIIGGFSTIIVGISILILPSGKQMGIMQMESYQYDESLARLHASLEKNPNDVVALKYLSHLYNILGKPEKEIHYLEQYVKLRPKDVEQREELAKIYLWNLKHEPAKEQFLAILKIEPNNVPVLRKLASSFLWEQEYHESLNCYLKIEELNQLNLDDYKIMIRIYMGMPDLKKALQIYLTIKEKYPEHFNDAEYLGLASIYLWLKQKKDAFDLHEEMLAETDDLLAARLSLIEWFIDKGIGDEVIPKLKTWIKKEPRNIILREALVDLYLQERMNKEAIAELKDTIVYIKNKDKYLTQLYWLLIEEKREEAAYEVSKQISDQMKDSEDLWASLGYLCLSLKHYDESYIYWKKVVTKSPDSIEAHDGFFEYYRLTKQIEKANKEFEWLIRRRPHHPHYMAYQIQLLIDQKEYEKAFAISELGHQIQSKNIYFQESHAACARELQKWDIALRFMKRLHRQFPKKFNYTSEIIDIYLALKNYDQALSYLNRAQFDHRNDDKILYKISLYFGYCNKPYRKMEILKTLEDRKPGLQYEEEILSLALDYDIHEYAKTILLHRLKKNPNDKTSFLSLYKLYKSTVQTQLQLEMLDHPKAKLWIGKKEYLQNKSTIAEDRGQYQQAIEMLEQLLVLESKRDDLRIKILTIAGWANNPKLEEAMVLKYAKAHGKEGLRLANLLYEQKKYKDCVETLDQLKKPYKNSIEAWQLRYYSSSFLKDKKLYHQALDFLITNEPDNFKRATYFSERAGIRYGLGQLQKAKDDAEAAFEFNPELNGAKIILGYIHYDLKEFRKSVQYFKQSQLNKLYDRFLLGAALMRFQEGIREGMQQFYGLMQEYRNIESFIKWNLYLDIGYELNSNNLIEKAWDNIMQKYYNPELLPRYALHLLYTDRKTRAQAIFKQLIPSDKPSYVALQKVFAPDTYKGKLSNNERMALADTLQRNGRWFEATRWLP